MVGLVCRQLQQLCGAISKGSAGLRVGSFGCSVANMEEVFLKVGEGCADDHGTRIDIRTRIKQRSAQRAEAREAHGALVGRADPRSAPHGLSINEPTADELEDAREGDDAPLLDPVAARNNGTIRSGSPTVFFLSAASDYKFGRNVWRIKRRNPSFQKFAMFENFVK